MNNLEKLKNFLLSVVCFPLSMIYWYVCACCIIFFGLGFRIIHYLINFRKLFAQVKIGYKISHFFSHTQENVLKVSIEILYQQKIQLFFIPILSNSEILCNFAGIFKSITKDISKPRDTHASYDFCSRIGYSPQTADRHTT